MPLLEEVDNIVCGMGEAIETQIRCDGAIFFFKCLFWSDVKKQLMVWKAKSGISMAIMKMFILKIIVGTIKYFFLSSCFFWNSPNLLFIDTHILDSQFISKHRTKPVELKMTTKTSDVQILNLTRLQNVTLLLAVVVGRGRAAGSVSSHLTVD